MRRPRTSPRAPARASRLALLVGVLAAAACSESVGGEVPDRVEVTSPETQLYVGQSVQLTATGYNGAGAELPSGDPRWSSSNAEVAEVSETGLVTAVGTGGARIRAEIFGREGGLNLVVDPAPPTADTLDIGPSPISPNVITLRRGGSVRFVFGATAGNVTFRPNQSGAPANIGSTTNAAVTRGFGTVGDFVFDNTLASGVTATIRVR